MVFAYLHLFGGLGYQIKRVYAVGILYTHSYIKQVRLSMIDPQKQHKTTVCDQP